MTNAELIKALRECANWIEAVAASSQYAHDELMALHYGDKLRDAADALAAADEKIADCVAAIDALDDSNDAYIKENERLKKQIDELKAQLPKEGEWRGLIIDGQYWAITCSNCHQVGFNARTPYCPNCGARMRGEHDE